MFLFGNCIDFDFSSMYPNAMCSFNIFAACMIGKLIIENCQGILNYDEDAGKEFVEDIIAQTPMFTGPKWFNLPKFMETVELINKKLGYN
jgi:hypothetical protein